MNKKPSENSVLVFVVFVLIMINSGGQQLKEPCARVIKGFYTWNVFIPIYFTLLIFSVRGLLKIRNLKTQIFTAILFSVVPLYSLLAAAYRLIESFFDFAH